jgi:beta-glucuronidase
MRILLITSLVFFVCLNNLWAEVAQTAMTNVFGRNCTSLNGNWQVIIDPMGSGDWREVWKEKKPQKKSDFFEYAFDGGPIFNVPGDFNTQLPELKFFEGIVWYKKAFTHKATNDKRYFLHFGAVNYLASVYLNGELIGKHEGGFTPFQFEITDKLIDGTNNLVVRVDNRRLSDGIPGKGYDWLNYGGITRDVNLITTVSTFIDDYFVQLKKGSLTQVEGWVKLNGKQAVQQSINVSIPELGINYQAKTDEKGLAPVVFSSKFSLWCPETPKLYRVQIATATDTVVEKIGFRSINTKGAQITLNGKPIFLKGVNIHEENPLSGAKAYSEADATNLLNWAKELGCNFVRLSHYPHNEYMVRKAEEMGLLVWDEIPVYQHIEFATPGVPEKISWMMNEMIARDRNRCSVFLWSLSNETYPTTKDRDKVLIEMAKACKQLDDTRLNTAVICTQGYANNSFDVWDTLYNYYDVISVNEYIGWYVPWQGKPEEVKWKLVNNEKPVLISEFGGEALYGSNYGPKDEAAYWSEEYQEQIYKDQVTLFGTVPNLCGVCPWLLVDYRSLGRMHPVYQSGWNRKGLLSERGDKKKAWYIMKDYFEGK